MISKIESRQNQRIKDLMKLSLPKYSKEQRLFKIEGMHALEMAKASGTLLSVFTTKEIPDLFVPQYLVSKEINGPISKEFSKISTDINMGLDIEIAFKRFSKRVKSEEKGKKCHDRNSPDNMLIKVNGHFITFRQRI